MPLIADVETARRRRDVLAVPDYTRTSREEDNYFVTMYFGAPPSTVAGTIDYDVDDTSLPQAYLVEQPAGSTIPAHYHDTDQYQVFIHGNARFGKKPIGPVTVHFAGGHTPYGPILTQEEATHFFTFRAHWDGGGKPMPENRDRLARVKRIYRLAAGYQPTGTSGQSEAVIATEDNGLGSTILHLSAGQRQTMDLDIPGGGQYLLILEGSVRHGETALHKHSCVFRYPDEKAVEVMAGERGASVLLLQFPQQESLETLNQS